MNQLNILLWIIIAIAIMMVFRFSSTPIGNETFDSCVPIKNANETCSFNCECLNDACGRTSAADGAPLICCPSDKIGNYGGYDYCEGLEDNEVCWYDGQCKSNICRGNQGGLTRGVCGKLQAGSTCTQKSDCANNACGRQSAVDGAPLICCPSGKIGTYAGVDYCEDLSDNQRCWYDAQCKSGHCSWNAGGTQRGICGKLAINKKCSVNADCVNGVCGKASAADDRLYACCESGSIYTYAGTDYCSALPDGVACWTDAMCKSGICRGSAGGLKRGICGKIRNNVGCNSNDECSSGACGMQSAAVGAKKICCPTGLVNTYAGTDYCGALPDGMVCWTDAMCKSGICRGSAGGTRRGICGKLPDKLPNNAECSSNNECNSGACGRPTAAAGAKKICCPTGVNTYAGSDYCSSMPKGSVCWSDSMCQSKNCRGNAGGLKRGICD